MAKKLGLDLGPNSLGWALIDTDAGELVAAGVRVFPEGVARDTQGHELSKNEVRRLARGARRVTRRRAGRRRRLRQLLVESRLLPAPASRPPGNPQRVAWEGDAFRAADPYELRRRALDERLEPYEIGRVLTHLAQRRGFLSNRKADRARKKETSEMLAEISGLESDIATSGARTLGEYLSTLNPGDPRTRVRGRHTRRDMYQREFEAIWEAQKPHHPAVLTEELRQHVRHLLFYQRPIRVPRRLIGTCELERNRRRCPRADRGAQRFRILQEVNNLLLIDEHGEERPLTGQERTELIAYLASSTKRTFDQIRKKLGLSPNVRFNLERGDRKYLYGMPTDRALAHKDRFGKAWDKLDDEKKNRVVRSLLDDDEPTVLEKATTLWGLSRQQAEAVLDADLPPGYMRFSREAIYKLLPHLERGLPLMTGQDRPCAITEAGYLRPDQRDVQRRSRLPRPLDVPNPVVRQGLFEVRRVVNAILREYGPVDQIHVELAREVKGSFRDRWEYIKTIRRRERQRDEARQAVAAQGVRPTRDAIQRYLLWREQETVCVYTGRPISLTQLLGGEVQVDHVLPNARSLDDSMMNKVVCFRDSNVEKGDRTPYEWLAEADTQRYDEVCLRARKLPYGKYRKFLLKNVELDKFVSRQLNDTAYISRLVRQYLECLVADRHRDILCTKGQLTGELRHSWGLDTILRDLPDSPAWREDPSLANAGKKDRSDHRHHAIDAIVVALTDRSRLQRLAREESAHAPWGGFRDDVVAAVRGMHVSHRVTRSLHGPLHEDTFYGKTDRSDWFVRRKPVKDLTLAEVERIRDKVVRAKVIERLQESGLEPGRKKRGTEGGGKILAEVWTETLWMNEEKGIAIRRVRVEMTDKSILPIRGGSVFVKPGNTHHLCIFEMPDGKRKPVFVTMLEAARRARDGQPIIQREHPDAPEARFLMSLSPGELVLADCNGEERILRYRTAASTQHQIYFVDARDARPRKEQKDYVFRPNTLNARKITVDPLGRIRWAND
jgi:CRISPR-associated endonuclease Csn1